LNLIFQPTFSLPQSFPVQHFGYSSRFKVPLRFKNASTKLWDTFLFDFIFDTGAEVSLAPEYLMTNYNYTPLCCGSIRGVIERGDCVAVTRLAWVSLKLVDIYNTESKEIYAKFSFCPSSTIMIIGMKDLIENLGFHKEIRNGYLILTTV